MLQNPLAIEFYYISELLVSIKTKRNFQLKYFQ